MWIQAMVRSPSLLLYQLCCERGFIPFMASQKDEGEIENNPPSNPSLSPPLSPSHWMSVQGPLLGKVVCNYGARWGLFLPATLLIWSFPLSSTKSTPLNRALHHAGYPIACEVCWLAPLLGLFKAATFEIAGLGEGRSLKRGQEIDTWYQLDRSGVPDLATHQVEDCSKVWVVGLSCYFLNVKPDISQRDTLLKTLYWVFYCPLLRVIIR